MADPIGAAATGASIGSIIPGIGTLAGGIGGLLGGLTGLFGGSKGPHLSFGDLNRLRREYGGLFRGIESYIPGLQARSRQQTYLTPEQYSALFRQLTSPGVANIEEQFGTARGRAVSDYASRGQLFGGSLTGTQAQLGVGQGRALSDLFANVGGQLGQLDVTLGAQRQAQAEAQMVQLLQAILSGQLNLGALARRG